MAQENPFTVVDLSPLAEARDLFLAGDEEGARRVLASAPGGPSYFIKGYGGRT